MCIAIGTPIIDVTGIYGSELLGEFTGLASKCLCQRYQTHRDSGYVYSPCDSLPAGQ
jgi:hypothetical protein